MFNISISLMLLDGFLFSVSSWITLDLFRNLSICYKLSLCMKYCPRFLSNFTTCASSVISLSLFVLCLMSFHTSLMLSVFMVSPTTSSIRNLNPDHHILLRLWLLYLSFTVAIRRGCSKQHQASHLVLNVFLSASIMYILLPMLRIC